MSRRRILALTALGVAAEAAGCAVFWRQLFGSGAWGTGGNLVAEVLLGSPALIWTHVVLHRHHRERMDQADEYHQALVKHVTATAGGGHVDD